uniref:AAA domain-containing protein, putative AbiEii toxin, Type IV TA system n=1 Tax=Candidatus Kentrum sp. SD TaxID=2126332 RepID=A0A450Y5L7_9GAMM|nr:MAG: AAA domain-containing protein, putative AbiEii toxin, Type IV TA system [Candidatus Kentron sp. SD]VFK40625.1 MAG: AAA domain-containing protein, putative AbiEii toxin, Type IV TA system [Candidatus Kentron sp. SD]
MRRNAGKTTNRTWFYPGARWWKFDFHTHTPASKDTKSWQVAIGTPEEVIPEKWLLQYMAAGIDCVAITDHNTGEWIDQLKAAYARMRAEPPEGFRELHLFPGVELSVNGGIHLLAIFDKDKTSAHIDKLLGSVGYKGTKGDSDGVTGKSAGEVIDAIVEAGGLALPAHADREKGLLHMQDSKTTMDSNTLKQVLENPGILAMEILDRAKPKPKTYTDKGLAWSEVLGSDSHNFRGEKTPGSGYTWVKMAAPSLEGLRLALLDGENFSLRRSDDPEPFDPFALPEHFIESIVIEDARYMGRNSGEYIKFSPWFNALIGGRGAGKSTVAHFLRLAYRREKELEGPGEESEVSRTFANFRRVPANREGTGGLTKNSATFVTLMRDGMRHRLTWREDDGGAVVEEEVDGKWRESQSQEVTPERFPLRLFSQGQIATLWGRGQEALLSLIDEAADTGPEKEAVEEARRRFLSLRAKSRELAGRLLGKEALAVKLEDVRRKLARFEQTNHARILKAYQLRTRQQRELDRQLDSAEGMAGRIGQLAEELVADDLPEGLFDVEKSEDAQAIASIGHIAQAIRNTAATLQTAGNALRETIQYERDGLFDTRIGWRAACDAAVQQHQDLAQGLQAAGVFDPNEYGQLVQERQRLEGEAWNLTSLEKERERINEEAKTQRKDALLQARRALTRKRREFLDRVLKDNPYVRMVVAACARDPRIVERSLREALGVPDRFGDDILVMEDGRAAKGIVPELLGDLPDEQEPIAEAIEERIEGLKGKIHQACEGEKPFGGHFNKFLAREAGNKPEFLDRILIWFPEDSLDIQYSPKGDGRAFRPIEQGSAGQRAAAMLAFLLSYGFDPIVLDQPEDDLDNHLIYDLIVRQIRDNKLRRQIIVITHNPNIVVNGDAEMLHALDFQGGQCRVVQAGSLQDWEMREEVCRIMEGGWEAFDSRYRRLGEIRDVR